MQAATALCGRQLPCQEVATAAGGRAGRERQPLVGWPPLARCLEVASCPLQVARPWSAAPAGGLAVASHLCMQTTCIWLPLLRRQRLLSLPIGTTSAYNNSTRFNLITRSLKPNFHTKTLALIPLLGNHSGCIT
ncbi:hypothetical protein B296_00054235 [Ensete ventricosum]|uniref:Uncharacterized protein n=1 Tax=Ensete ventricosum TaxID=4639 RepID=A0A426XFI2_ENSVE|nr:hypothetical protein B296_00054235 [Ensete ventricosum]